MPEIVPRILAHRGGADGLYPENSIPAFLEGIRAGADVLELDVRRTSDGRVVVLHDADLGRVSGSARPVSETSLYELQQVDLQDASGRVHPGVRVPLLDEVLEACPAARLNIDIKADDAALVRALTELLQRHGAASRVTVGSFLSSALQLFRTLAPHIETSAHPGEVKQLLMAALLHRPPRSPAARLQVPVRHGIVPIVRRGFVDFLHRHGLAIDVWTINDPAEAQRLAALGVDGIVTDRVRVLRSALGDTHEHT